MAGDVGGGRGHPDHERLGKILVPADIEGFAAESGDREGRGAENLRFGNVGVGVEVEQVAGRAVRLVAHEEPVGVGPLDPGVQVIEVQLGERIAVVALDAGERVAVHRLRVHELGRELLEVVAVHLPEDLGEPRRPGRAVILERVMKLPADQTPGKLANAWSKGARYRRKAAGE
jgi:hypothetical protein